MKKITILGNGSWGTALAHILKPKNNVTLWGPLKDELAQLAADKENKKYLPGISLADIMIEADIAAACKDAGIIILVIPTKFLRAQLEIIAPHVNDDQYVVCASKGIETGTLKLVSDLVAEFLPGNKNIMALSGPSHAEEAAAGIPTAVTVACPDIEKAREVQEACKTDTFRIYTNDDLTGVEIGGAVKNIIAIAAGISDGLGYGSNTIAALMTRGMVEIIRFGTYFQARTDTFYGLSGIGDLITTCISKYSRNHYVGEQIATGKTLTEIEASMTMVAEGVNTVKAVREFCQKHSISMPICEAVYQMIFEGREPREAVLELMTREAKSEN